MPADKEAFHIWSIVGDCYVSTIYRQASVGPTVRYYETMIFERNKQTGELGRILHCLDTHDIEIARKRHWQITKSLLEKE